MGRRRAYMAAAGATFFWVASRATISTGGQWCADTMLGGAGDDVLIVDNAGDVISELANQGHRRVNSFVSVTLLPMSKILLSTGRQPQRHRQWLGNILNGLRPVAPTSSTPRRK